MAATACLVVVTSFAFTPVDAHAAAPKPSATEVRKKLTKLNEEVDQAVEKYNKINEQLKIAKRKLDAAKKSSKGEEASFEQQRSKIAQMAADAYKNGDSADVTGFVGSKDPQSILDQAAVFTHLSQERSSQLTQFLATAQRLRREQAQAQAAYDDVAGKAKELKDKKGKLDKQVNEQKKLLKKLGVKTPSSNGGGNGGAGGSYNGPASGSARTALNFAYAQLGKPYSYGAAGPGSYDCSGLTMRSWGAAGVSITRTTNSQYAATKHIDKSALQPGDLVFFSNLGHVGMYVGGGKMIHAPHTGDVVKISDITSGYYQSNFYGATRP
ncbi:C40 family peptidase [Actinomadura rubrisoli]|uniref:C40 family peptidase n=1 Tax=Actinomadura rubrisoli TaxID=2530368 RepID=UPI001FB67762|nr:C40 family peptidase [Actinomadura rubrisoli]